jgi:predicted dehydrogenase
VPWFRGKAYYDEQPWRGQLETAGGGCMINQSVHTLDLLYYLCGDIDAIHGSVNQLADYGIEVEDTVAARLHFANGANGVFFATNCDYTNESVQIKVACEKASFLIEDDALFRIDADGVRTKLCENEKLPGAKFYFGASHGILIDKFYRAIENNTDDYIHVRDAEMSIRLIDAIHASSKAGHPVAP